MQPSEIDFLPYYELEYTVSLYHDMLKERKSAENDYYESERDKYNIDKYKNQKLSNIKLPNAGKMPNIKIPKL